MGQHPSPLPHSSSAKTQWCRTLGVSGWWPSSLGTSPTGRLRGCTRKRPPSASRIWARRATPCRCCCRGARPSPPPPCVWAWAGWRSLSWPPRFAHIFDLSWHWSCQVHFGTALLKMKGIWWLRCHSNCRLSFACHVLIAEEEGHVVDWHHFSHGFASCCASCLTYAQQALAL